jgi:polyhydroxyalkanoate synthesis regulator protein
MAKPIRIIKKYPNCRLYDTANSGYIVGGRQADGARVHRFPGIDAKSGDDLTPASCCRSFSRRNRSAPCFPAMLSHDPFYGNTGHVGNYMEQNVKVFMAIQGKLLDQAKQIYGDKDADPDL